MAAMLATVLASSAALAQTPRAPGVYRGGQIQECPPPGYPREALRYELQGKTQIEILIGEDGKPQDKRVVKSSGWAMLDDATLDFFSACRFTPVTVDGKAAGAQWQPMVYVWALSDDEDGAASPPAMQRESCPAADRITMVTDALSGDGMLLRFLTSPQGNVFGVKIENSSGDAATDAQAIRALEVCQFAPSLRNGKPAPGNAFARYRLTPQTGSERP